jgi:hypothetical protein
MRRTGTIYQYEMELFLYRAVPSSCRLPEPNRLELEKWSVMRDPQCCVCMYANGMDKTSFVAVNRRSRSSACQPTSRRWNFFPFLSWLRKLSAPVGFVQHLAPRLLAPSFHFLASHPPSGTLHDGNPARPVQSSPKFVRPGSLPASRARVRVLPEGFYCSADGSPLNTLDAVGLRRYFAQSFESCSS